MPTTHASAPPFETHDLYLSAALLTCGYALAGVQRRDNRAVFCFASAPEIAETAQRFYTAQLPVDARAFADHLKALKNVMFTAGGGR